MSNSTFLCSNQNIMIPKWRIFWANCTSPNCVSIPPLTQQLQLSAFWRVVVLTAITWCSPDSGFCLRKSQLTVSSNSLKSITSRLEVWFNYRASEWGITILLLRQRDTPQCKKKMQHCVLKLKYGRSAVKGLHWKVVRSDPT